jgi:accessory colonization factor AcfC
MSGMARADMVQLYAAGSLRAALNDVGNAFHTRFGIAVQAKYGPSCFWHVTAMRDSCHAPIPGGSQ